MSLSFSCVVRPTRLVGRAYSSFFSSKPGGGRHFVSAKPPKPVLQHSRTNADNTTTAGPPSESSTTSSPTDITNVMKAAPADEKPSSKPTEAHPQSSLPRSPSSSAPQPFAYSFSASDLAPIHPTVSSKEYKLHQFFSLHRPLLLLSQPTSTIFETVDPSTSLFTSCEDQVDNDARSSFATIDNPPEPSSDADADAARQLAHALVMNRIGGAIVWQSTLSHLGLSIRRSDGDMTSAKQSAQEWVSIHADSTRRKRRKKMKKHKLKKRRRLTRHQNK